MAAAKKRVTPKSEPDHPCIARIDKILAASGARLLRAIRIGGGPRDIFVSTEKLEGGRGRPFLLVSKFCPFCGERISPE